jgi:hypothetical protein
MAIRQHEAGTTLGEIYRNLEISATTFCRRRKHDGGMGVTELRELRQRCEEPLATAAPNDVTAGSHCRSRERRFP